MRKICFVTGTRAEYGLMSRLMLMVKTSPATNLQVIATNMHLSKRYGETYKEIENDGIHIDKKVPILNDEAEDNARATLASMAMAMNGLSKAYEELRPDLIVLLGDRYEILAAATVALIERIPVAHIHGGEVTEGAYDDAIRHSITKMSQLHFTSTEEYRKRVIQLGESPDRVFNTGALGVENIKKTPLMCKDEVEKSIGFTIDKNTILVTYHPVTLGINTAENDISNFLEALEQREDLRIIFTMPNSDTGGRVVADAIENFVTRNKSRAVAFKSLGMKRYLSVMGQVAAVVGNSSSGILEAPSFGIPTLDIGDRQKGRAAADSIFHCNTDKVSIIKGLETILSSSFKKFASQTHNPYEKEGTAQAIFDIISTLPLDGLLQKHFYDIK